MKQFITPNDLGLKASSDSRSIQNAVDKAHKTGLNKVVIPRKNRRTGQMIWVIDKSILLPSDMTIVLQDAHLRMADGVMDTMFRNANAWTAEGKKAQGRQYNIHIVGQGNAVLDGGNPNGLDEFTSRKDGRPPVQRNLLIYFHNVKDFSITGFTVRDQRWWAMAFLFASKGRIADLHFRLTRHAIDTHERWRNQDGVDLRLGCNNIIIENLEGEAGDDFIAMTALNSLHDAGEWVEGEKGDIHDIIIRDIRAVTSQCAVIRMLNHYGNKIYNVSMTNIFDAGQPGTQSKSQTLFRIGDGNAVYYREDPTLRASGGDLQNITIDNVFSRSMCAVNLCENVKNMTIRNVHVHSDGGYVLTCGFFQADKVFLYDVSREDEHQAIRYLPFSDLESMLRDVLIENVYYTADGKHADALIGVWKADMENITVRNIHNDTELPLIKCFGGNANGINIE